MRRAGRVGGLVLLGLLAIPDSVLAQRSIAIQRFEADIRVEEGGAIEVLETMHVRFTGSWNGIIRMIPVEWRTPQGLNYTLLLDVAGVSDAGGQPLRYESSRERHYRQLKIWVPGAVDAVRTVRLSYRVRNGLKFFEQHDELYWNVTGDEWEMPIEAAVARVRLPPDVDGVRATAFTGGYGSVEQAAAIDIDGPSLTVRTLRPLGFREGLTIAVGWSPGVVARPGALTRAGWFLQSNLMLLVPIGILPLMWWVWHTRGRDPRLRPIAPRYEPPAKMTPAELGTLVDNSPDLRDISASIVDLAVRGYLLIEEREEPRFLGLFSSTDYLLTLRKERGAWGDLMPHERKLLIALFKVRTAREAAVPGRGGSSLDLMEGDWVALSDLENKFHADLPGIRDSLYQELIDRGHYARRPDRVRQVWLAAGVVVAGAALAAGLALHASIGHSQITAVLAALLTAAIVCGFGWYMPARTTDGARVLEEVLGFEEFLSRVESDRFARVIKTPEMFERYLPYAMALGVEKNWAAAFEGIYTKPPDWYRGAATPSFRPVAFTGRLSQMSSRVGSVMTSAPRGSGGSGFSGGGRSGGGFGGGGGRGF